MSPTGTRVVPTLTEVLDEQRLGRSATGLSTEAWPGQRASQDDLVPISLDWGDEPASLAGATPEPGDVMTPWQVVPPRDPSASLGDAHFIDLSIDVAPVQPPPLHAQVLDVYATPSENLDALPAVLEGTARRETAPAGDVGAPEAPFRFGDAEAEAASLKPLSLDDLARAYPQHAVAAAVENLRAFDPSLPLLAEAGPDLALDLSGDLPLVAPSGADPQAFAKPEASAAADVGEGLPALVTVEQPELDRLAQNPMPTAPIEDAPAPVLSVATSAERDEGMLEEAFEDTVESFGEALDGSFDEALDPTLGEKPEDFFEAKSPASTATTEPVSLTAELTAPARSDAAASALAPLESPQAPVAAIAPPVDPGTLAVRQGSAQGHGVSEERLQAIIDKALDRLLRDELPSALVETLIRLSPQLSESLIESLKPSLHLHVVEALAKEARIAPESRTGDPHWRS